MHIWISVGIGVASILFAAGVAWGMVNYKVAALEKTQADLKSSNATIVETISSLSASLNQTIREEFDKAIARINKIVFEDSGTSRYLPRSDCDRYHDGCRADMLARIERLERKLGDR